MSANGASATSADLEGKVVLVTGAGSGIGEACAHRAAAGGARVAVVDITREAAERVASEIGGDARAIVADVAEEGSVADMVATVVEQFGRLDGAINNAGIGGAQFAVGDYSLDDWRRVMRVNLDGVFLCLREEIRAMRTTGGGSIVNMASVLAAAGYPEQVAYVTSKHALVGLTRVAALDHASDGIRVNAVGPAFILTPLVEQTMTPEAIAAVAPMHALGRWGRPEEVAEMTAWLLSDAASFATATFYPLDGGLLAR
ncbi:MAG TPA: SDR family NAD(P)-dependent oxidoreductase [Thermoleophilaceae bacterium]|jgi:NAD(P)-dependent dehydrogenase (short-subunit alcohol dehydrogenase family)|nr:SDR family NAD(P)-dependent oxidoreductase [Thermoleophilaceae bacterium]